MSFLLKLIGSLLLLGIALFVPGRLCWAFADKFAVAWGGLARRRAVGLVLTFLLSLVASAAVCLSRPLPQPGTQDEFSYLLAADTFLHGRLTNPPHPLGTFFESMHILQQPTYMSKYPPGQGLFLALGILLLGHPIAGVWLSLALACAAIAWMLQAWLPPRWAVLGGVLAALSLASTAWAQTYWGGAVAALGGALVFGALRRIVRAGRWRHGLVLGVGLAILANSRPYEGLVACLPVAVLLALWAWRRRQSRGQVIAVAVPVVLVLVLTGAWMAWYNFRITGQALRMPYQVHDATYAAAPLFLWQSPRNPVPQYHHPVMRAYYVDWELSHFLRKRFAFGLNWSAFTRLWTFFRFYVGPLFFLPLVVLAKYSRNRWMGFAALTCGLVLLALTQTLYLFPHYAAPITCLVFALIVQGLRYVQLWQWRGRPVGRILVPGTVALLLLLVLLPAANHLLNGPPPLDPRHEIVALLERSAGSHLVVVRYGANHSCHEEWVYNDADMDGARVIWARDMGAAENRKLLSYFKERRAWLLEVDEGPGPLRRYPAR